MMSSAMAPMSRPKHPLALVPRSLRPLLWRQIALPAAKRPVASSSCVGHRARAGLSEAAKWVTIDCGEAALRIRKSWLTADGRRNSPSPKRTSHGRKERGSQPTNDSQNDLLTEFHSSIPAHTELAIV